MRGEGVLLVQPERIKRVENQVARELAVILDQDIKDPRVGMATVSRVRVSKDLRAADIHVSRLGDNAQEDADCMAALAAASGYIRKLLGERIALRFLPELRFHLDTSARKAMELEKLFKEIEAERADRATLENSEEGGPQ
jgi:ribosome-binding factor A